MSQRRPRVYSIPPVIESSDEHLLDVDGRKVGPAPTLSEADDEGGEMYMDEKVREPREPNPGRRRLTL